jgi:hypothetical protein
MHLHQVPLGMLMPAGQQMSFTTTPASACLRSETIWVSVNRDFFTGTSWMKHARKFYFLGVYLAGEAYGCSPFAG